jgi:ribonuclease Y
MPSLITVLGFAVILGLGIAVGYYLRYLQALSKKTSIEIEIKEKLVEAEKRAIEIIEKAENKAQNIEQEAKIERKTQEEKLTLKEEHLLKREEMFDSRQIDLDSQREALQAKILEIKSIKAQLDERKKEIETKLEEVASLSKEEAYNRIVTTVEKERTEDLRLHIEKVERLGSEQFEERAQNLLLAAIHRVGNNLPSNVMTAHVEIPKR